MPSFAWRVLLLLLLLPVTACRPRPSSPSLRVSLVGDILLARAVPAAIQRANKALSSTARALWTESQYVIGNLECPLTTVRQPMAKRIVFRADPRYAVWLRRLGLTHLSLANNHSLDQHRPGLRDTDRALRHARLGTIGYEPDSATGCHPTLLGADSSVAVFAYSALRQGVSGEACICGRDFAAFCERLAAYKTLFPQRAVLVYLHWGTEYAEQPSAAQRQQARTLIDCGAAAVVGAHPHVVQPVEFYRGRPILYSLGNFLFDQRGRATDLAVQVDFDVRDGHVRATHLRPLQLVGAIPRRADGRARAALAARIRRLSPAVRLVEEAGGWRVTSSNPDPTPDTDAGFFVRELDLSTAAGAAGVRLTYQPARHEYRVGSQVGRGRHVSRATTSFRYPVYRLTQGDADNDGQMDVLVGPVKTTHFDATIQRRLFIYHLDSTGRLRPRWLGSRVIYPLVYFRAGRGTDGRTFIQTIEHPAGQGYCVGRYYWQGFGLSLDHFLARQLSLDAAYSRFLLS